MKKEYIKPQQSVVVMRYSQMLCTSVESLGLDNGDELLIEDDPIVDPEFWGR
jgi:hypothetical protein